MRMSARLAGIALCIPLAATPAAAGHRHAAAHGPVAPLAQALWGADAATAAKAAGALGASANPAAHDALLDALAFGLPSTVAVAALAALPAHPAPPDVDALRRYARDRDPEVRSAALDALAHYADHAARAAIVRALGDKVGAVRSTAAAAAATAHVTDAIAPLLALLDQGEDGAATALAALADPDLARKIADHVGRAPAATLVKCLGLVLRRPDFPDPTRVEIVGVLGKLDDPAALAALAAYVDATPAKPPRPSRDAAQKLVSAKRGGHS